jgi:hypothetical protein
MKWVKRVPTVIIGISGSTGIVLKLFYLSQITKRAAFTKIINFCFFLLDFVRFRRLCNLLPRPYFVAHILPCGLHKSEGRVKETCWSELYF